MMDRGPVRASAIAWAVLAVPAFFACWAGSAVATPPAGSPPPARLELIPRAAEQALEALGWAPQDVRLDPLEMGLFGGDRYVIPVFRAWTQRPFVIPWDVEVFQRSSLAAVHRPADLLVVAATRIGHGVRRGLVGDPAAELAASLDAADPLGDALARVWAAAPPGSPSMDQAATDALLRAAPLAWRDALARVLAAAAGAAHQVNAGLPAGAPDTLALESARYVLGMDAAAMAPAEMRRFEEKAARTDIGLLQAAAADLLMTLDRCRDWPGPGPREPIRAATPLGQVVIGTTSDDAYPEGSYLLIIDPAGSDSYRGGARAVGGAVPVSVLLDLSGNDRHAATDSLAPGPGSGVAGIGLLLDLGGNDVYQARSLALGCGLCGVGLLYDRWGDDTYDAEVACQGAGLFGLGVLADSAGTDRYHAFQQAQGYGYTLGCGLLVDGTGDDRYIADDSIIRYPSAQSPEHNSSLAQGFGFGKRADITDGHSLAGGFGMLVDGAGDDKYECGVFGQGAGYWYGVGILADGRGQDEYRGIWYTQGSAAHFAVGVLWDGGGNDRLHAAMNMAMGAGHDFSLGMLYDRSGDDLYEAPNLSLGGGNANGLGIFWDVAGADEYRVTGATTLGRSNTGSRGGLRDRMSSLGLFLDTGGHDLYPASVPCARNQSVWTQAGMDTKEPLPTEAGAGCDTE